MLFFQFFYLILMSISLFKSKKGVYLPAGAGVASGTSAQADVVRGTTAQMRRGTKATWQGRIMARARHNWCTGRRHLVGGHAGPLECP